MKFKWLKVVTACAVLFSFAAVAGCTQTQDPPADDGTNIEQPENDYGTLSIENVTVQITKSGACTFAELNPVFSKPDKAETLTYTYDTADIKIENGVVTPLRRADKTVNVRAKSEHFNIIFTVEIEYLRFNETGSLYDVSKFANAISNRADRCGQVTANTTLFVGDSFMDDAFIGAYMQTYSAGKDVLNAGISSTTSYHWEAAYKDIIGNTAPKNIVIHIGTNNFYDEHDLVEDTEASLVRLFSFLHSSYPTSHIYWFNITQRVNTEYAARVSETNAYMGGWCEKYDWITCVDTSSKMGTTLLHDKVHPTDAGYKVMTDELEKAGCVISSKS